MKPRFKADRVEFRVGKADELALQGAAYVLTESAYAAVDASGAARTVVLWPKKGVRLKDLARDFAQEYENQILRWKLLRLNLKVKKQVLERAFNIVAPTETAVGAVPAALSQERLREIEEAVTEASAEKWDPLGIARHWEDTHRASS